MQVHNPPELVEAIGFSHVVVTGPGETIYLAGQTGHHADGSLDDGLVAQFASACGNVATALRAVGAKPSQVVAIQIFVTDMAGYRAARKEIGEKYREVFDRHYPAMSLFEVRSLVDPDALVELVATAHRVPRNGDA
jgi:enamine deaminase RidA (YjgF/YER057c/UK114 family)